MSLPEYVAIVVDKKEEIDEYLKGTLPKHSQIFLVGDHEYGHPKVIVVKADTTREIGGIVYKFMFDNRLVHIVCGEELKEVKDVIMGLIALDKSFAFGNGGLASIENFWRNLKHIVDCPNSGSLKGLLKGKPCVLVSSGPSLDKNINVLKEYQDKVVIIACGSAIGALHKQGIVADYVVTVDPFQLLEDCIMPHVTEKTTLLTSVNTYHGLVDKFPGNKVFYYNSGSIAVAGDLIKYLDVSCGVYSSSTVTTPAFSLALFMDAAAIILIGQDMCIYDDKVYADGVLPDTIKDLHEVESIDGRKMMTYTTYKEVWNYFNILVPKIQGRDIVNATENGLGVKGAKVMTLREAAEQYFIEDKPILEISNSNVKKAELFEELKVIKFNLENLVKYIGFYKKYIN